MLQLTPYTVCFARIYDHIYDNLMSGTHVWVCVLCNQFKAIKKPPHSAMSLPTIPLIKAAIRYRMGRFDTYLSLFSFNWVRSVARMLMVTLPCLFIAVSPFLEDRNSGGHSA